MREATLGGVSTFDGTQPRARAAKRRPAGPQRREGGWSSLRRIRSRLALIVGSAGFSAIMIGIVLNATMMQKGHHPAPLFATAAPVRPAPPVVPAAPQPAPTVAPAPVPVPAPALVEPARPLPAPSPTLHPVVHTAPVRHAAKPADGIARLLGFGAPPAGKTPSKPKSAAPKVRPGQPAHEAAAAAAAVKLHPKTTAE